MLAGFIGNGAGVLLIGACMIIMRHLKSGGGSSTQGQRGAPSGGGGSSGWKAWIMRIVIFFMFAGGTALSLAGAGAMFQRAGKALLSLAGPNGAYVIGTLIALFLLAEVVVLAWKKPSPKVAWSAVFLTFSFTLVTTGPVGRIGQQLRQVGTQYSTQFDVWMRS